MERRKFLRTVILSALSSLSVYGCGKALRPTAVPTALPAPTATGAAKTIRSARSALVRTRHDGVWKGENLSGEILLQMLDTSIAALTGIRDAGQSWKSLFKPTERVAIKVNAIVNGAVHAPLVMAVTQRLQDSGIAPERILIYDRTSDELKNAGFVVNRTEKGIRCYGSDGEYIEVGQVFGMPARLNRSLMECDALINMCILKGFTLGGMSFALKNHYGSVENPSRFHNNFFTPGITGLNALPEIKGRTRLVIGDLLSPETRTDYTNYIVLGELNSILMSRDPVAIDAVGLEIASTGLESAKGLNTKGIQVQTKEWLQAAEDKGLGVSEMERIDIREFRL